MLEIIAFICAIAVCIWTPIEAKKVHSGWVRPKFKGTPEEFRARYMKQLKMFTWLGFGLGAAYVAIALTYSDDQARMITKLAIGVVWIGVGIVNLMVRRKYFETPAGI